MKYFFNLLVTFMLATSIFAFGCGEDSDSSDDNEPEENLSGSEDDAGSSAVTLAAQPVYVATEFYGKDEGLAFRAFERLDKIKAIKSNIEKSLKESSCSSLELNETSFAIDADFTGECIIEESGVSIEGTLSITLSQSDGSIAAEFKFTNFSIDGSLPITGEVSLKRSNQTTFEISLSVSANSQSLSFSGSVTFSETELVLNGSGTYRGGEAEFDIEFKELKWVYIDCYPSSGSVKLAKEKISVTIVFSEETATTGKVEATVGKKTETVDLTPYGSCPPAA